MIVLDTTILVYAVGADHPLRDPCRRLITWAGDAPGRATTTAEVVQEFVHVFARRRSRADAAALGREYADLLAPLLPVGRADLDAGLAIFERMPALGAFDAVLAAAAANAGPEGLMSADAAFASIPGVAVLAPSEDTLIRLGA